MHRGDNSHEFILCTRVYNFSALPNPEIELTAAREPAPLDCSRDKQISCLSTEGRMRTIYSCELNEEFGMNSKKRYLLKKIITKYD